jgi:hypothetical protein
MLNIFSLSLFLGLNARVILEAHWKSHFWFKRHFVTQVTL